MQSVRLVGWLKPKGLYKFCRNGASGTRGRSHCSAACLQQMFSIRYRCCSVGRKRMRKAQMNRFAVIGDYKKRAGDFSVDIIESYIHTRLLSHVVAPCLQQVQYTREGTFDRLAKTFFKSERNSIVDRQNMTASVASDNR
ncbi:hypothetical protein IscW_ISCW007985 [Ixodes scapularis]|uniref:Uncharacterized protein n=1 Tax=Ixodes scapularis TaxID=6945 RepID=B7PTV2_IXOSC|nr:hypothetical protein IscW_ISCW007985 [Ixodes scapularis]|eukprot:XP_002404960.1 hypothetical protein IscW_ISCW007985 [Ixodes scapularis]